VIDTINYIASVILFRIWDEVLDIPGTQHAP
jgi:hypothetical protein